MQYAKNKCLFGKCYVPVVCSRHYLKKSRVNQNLLTLEIETYIRKHDIHIYIYIYIYVYEHKIKERRMSQYLDSASSSHSLDYILHTDWPLDHTREQEMSLVLLPYITTITGYVKSRVTKRNSTKRHMPIQIKTDCLILVLRRSSFKRFH